MRTDTYIFRHIAPHVSHTACLRAESVLWNRVQTRFVVRTTLKCEGRVIDDQQQLVHSFCRCLAGSRRMWMCAAAAAEASNSKHPRSIGLFSARESEFSRVRSNELTLWFMQTESRNDFSFDFHTSTAGIFEFRHVALSTPPHEKSFPNKSWPDNNEYVVAAAQWLIFRNAQNWWNIKSFIVN